MVKLILATLVCAFIASPALASEFQVEQTKMINSITMNMEKYKSDANKIAFLTEKKDCVEKATDMSHLNGCISALKHDQLKSASTVSQ